MKKFLISFSLIFFNILIFQSQSYFYGQLNKYQIDSTKIEIYRSILLSKEIKDKNKLQLISIQTTDLEIDYQTGYISFLKDAIKQRDSLSVPKLKKLFPYYYFFHEEDNYDIYRKYTKQKEIMYNVFHEYTGGIMKDYTYIRIFEPLDNWINLYLYLSHLPDGAPSEIIPVLYTRMRNNKEIERKYMLYEVIFSKEGKIESIKVVN